MYPKLPFGEPEPALNLWQETESVVENHNAAANSFVFK